MMFILLVNAVKYYVSYLMYCILYNSGVIRTLTPLDRETVPHYWLTVCAQDHGLVPRHSCVQVIILYKIIFEWQPVIIEYCNEV